MSRLLQGVLFLQLTQVHVVIQTAINRGRLHGNGSCIALSQQLGGRNTIKFEHVANAMLSITRQVLNTQLIEQGGRREINAADTCQLFYQRLPEQLTKPPVSVHGVNTVLRLDGIKQVNLPIFQVT